MIDFSKTKIGIVSLTVGNWDLMYDHMNSIYESFPFNKEFYIIPNIDFGMSLSEAINKGFKRAISDGCDYIVYCADDVVLGKDSIQTITSFLIENDKWITIGVGKNASWDFFVVNPILFDEVGFWDESFYPAYFEDNDFARRIHLKDATKTGYCPADFEHIGSQTVKRFSPVEMAKHHNYFEINRKRYVAMWGGPPGQETYTVKWNGEAPRDDVDGRKVYGDFKEKNIPEKSVWPTAEDYKNFPGI